MEKVAIWIVVGMIAAIIILNRMFKGPADNRQYYLQTIAKLLGGTLEQLEGSDNSFKIDFIYHGINFTYSDIEDTGYKERTYRGILRAQTHDDLIMSFTESSRAQLRADVTSISDVLAPWGKNVDKVRLTKELKDFVAFTNHASKANALMADEQILKIFLKFKNMNSRGHPIMSLEILEGALTLKFHPAGSGLNPNLFDLQNSPSSIASYLEKMLVIINKINQLKADEVK